ncbi:DinB family protein [Galbibacter sp. PAP.153]|uniref:DinB family protein n=1 Tax=Galbibacter sp. PAP.153 TaxID=3104623 RepID=UPI00300A5CD2
MKKLIFITLALFSFIMKAQDTPITAFLEKWNNSKDYLLKIAELMPEENYTFKPTEREMTFEEQLLHIKQNMDWLGNAYFNAPKIDAHKKYANKEALINALIASFNNVYNAIEKTRETDLKQKVDFFAGEKTKLQTLNLLQDHVTHHRGQLIVYLNLNNIEPPKYIGW